MNQEFIVVCRECGEHHFTEEVTFLNIEENVNKLLLPGDVCLVLIPRKLNNSSMAAELSHLLFM